MGEATSGKLIRWWTRNNRARQLPRV